jgi:hypothetical protein
VIDRLRQDTSAIVIKKLNQIVRCNIFSIYETQWLEQSVNTGNFSRLKQKDQNEYLDTLNLFSKDKNDIELAQKASDLYEDIIENSIRE